MTAEPNLSSILIIDDDQYIREMLMLLFEAEGAVQIETAANGVEGLKKLRSYPEPFVVYLDLMMPTCSGWDVLKAVEQEPLLRMHKIAIMSASRPDTSELAGYQFLPKPLDMNEVVRFAKLSST